MFRNSGTVRRLRAIAESDPGAVIRVLQQFQVRDIVPSNVRARPLGSAFIDIEVEVSEIAAEMFRVVVAKINELPSVVTAVACD